MNKLQWLLPLLIATSILACKSNESNNDEPQNEDVQISKGFDNFYKKFHRDSAFQLAHIRFPLPGKPSFQDSLKADEEFYWEKDDWLIQQEVDFSTGDFKQELINMDNLVIERVFLPQGFYIERRFYNADGNWSLIYYSDINHGQPK